MQPSVPPSPSPRPPPGGYPLLSKGLREGAWVPFLGAGASAGPCLPDGGKLSLDLIKAANLEHPHWYRPIDCKCSCNCDHSVPPLDRAASLLLRVWHPDRTELNSLLHAHFSAGEPRRVHLYLASLPGPRLIFSTNYDLLLERAFLGTPIDVLVLMPGGHNEPPRLVLLQYDSYGHPVASDVDFKYLARTIDPSKRTVIFKIHGSVIPDELDAPLRSGFLISQEDYESALLNIEQFLPPVILAHLDGRQILFLGYGLKDWNVRALLRRLGAYLHPPRGIAVFLRATPADHELWKDQLHICDSDIDEFIGHLENGP